MNLPSKTDVLIVGGGLAGLCLARHLDRAGVDFQLVESRPRWGGRIKTGRVDDVPVDLGPTWFWPGQTHMESLVKENGLGVFEQFASGDLLYEDEAGQVMRGRGYASMAGSLRLAGGMSELISSLVAQLPGHRLHLETTVRTIGASEVQLSSTQTMGRMRYASLAIALPPRLAQSSIRFEPVLEDNVQQAMQRIPTWMAPQAKAVATFDAPFWRGNGLSGDAMSRHGPLAEIHDASPVAPGPGALFGFIGLPPEKRADRDALEDAVRAQLHRLFGPGATPLSLLIEDWATEPNTSTPDDLVQPQRHPDGGMPVAMRQLEQRGIYFCASEVAPNFAGYLEGAVEAATQLAEHLTHH